jgi:uncharacterized membrane protein
MAFCPGCGTPTEGRFCPKCGAAIPGGVPAGGAPAATGLASNVAATLCYIPVLLPSILFLAVAPYNRDKSVRFHAWQSLFLQIAWIVVSLVLSMVLAMISWRLWYLLSRVLNLAVVLVALYMMWKTYQNEKVHLPVLGELAEKQA